MIGYVTLGTTDMDRAKSFYLDLFKEKGAANPIDKDRISFISTGRGQPMLAVCIPYDEKDPQPGNGTMIAFTADSKEDVDALYAKAISLGATCDGEPGQRIPNMFYGAYVRDLDGNKICFYVFA